MTDVNSPISPSSTSPGVSVALCTYNGEKYLPQQLASMLEQTRVPDELVVCDDCSTDRTPELLEEFAREAPFPIRVVRNRANLGSSRNFEQAVSLCTRDLIALSDQDDLWYPQRLARSEAELRAHPEAALVFSDGDIIDDDGNRIGARLWKKFQFDADKQAMIGRGDYRALARWRFVTGATVMFRAAYREHYFPVGSRWVHDGWMAMMTSCFAEVRMISEPLIAYRRHASQQVGLGKRGEKTWRPQRHSQMQWGFTTYSRKNLDEVCAAIDRLPRGERERDKAAAACFQDQRDFYEMRADVLLQKRLRRIPTLLKYGPLYRRCARGTLSQLRDLALPVPQSLVEWSP